MKRAIISMGLGALCICFTGCKPTVESQIESLPASVSPSLPTDAVATHSAVENNKFNAYAQVGIYNIPNQFNFTDIVRKGVKITTWIEYEDKNGKTKQEARITNILDPENKSEGSILFTFICSPGKEYYTFYTMTDIFRKRDLGGMNTGASTKLELSTSFLVTPGSSQQQMFEKKVDLPLILNKTIELGKHTFDKFNLVKDPSLGPTSSRSVPDKASHREVRQYCKFTLLSSQERDLFNRVISKSRSSNPR